MESCAGYELVNSVARTPEGPSCKHSPGNLIFAAPPLVPEQPVNPVRPMVRLAFSLLLIFATSKLAFLYASAQSPVPAPGAGRSVSVYTFSLLFIDSRLGYTGGDLPYDHLSSRLESWAFTSPRQAMPRRSRSKINIAKMG